MALRRSRADGSLNTISPSAARSSAPVRTTCGQARAISINPSLFGATASRARASVSTMNAPRSSKILATALLPAPIPPVRPIRTALLGDRNRLRWRNDVDLLDDHRVDLFGRYVRNVLDRSRDATRLMIDR